MQLVEENKQKKNLKDFIELTVGRELGDGGTQKNFGIRGKLKEKLVFLKKSGIVK